GVRAGASGGGPRRPDRPGRLLRPGGVGTAPRAGGHRGTGPLSGSARRRFPGSGPGRPPLLPVLGAGRRLSPCPGGHAAEVGHPAHPRSSQVRPVQRGGLLRDAGLEGPGREVPLPRGRAVSPPAMVPLAVLHPPRPRPAGTQARVVSGGPAGAGRRRLKVARHIPGGCPVWGSCPPEPIKGSPAALTIGAARL